MLIKNFMTKNLVKTTPDTKISDVAKLMKEENVGSVLIMEGDELLGVVSDRDIVVNLEIGCDSPVEKIMSKNVVTIRDNLELYQASKLLSEYGIKRLPVLNRSGKVVGVISMDDIMIVVITELSNLADVIVKPSKLIE